MEGNTADAGDRARYRTEPPDVATPSLKRRIGERASVLLMPLIEQAARPYLGGRTIQDALCVADRLHASGFATSFSYWDGGDESADDIATVARDAMRAMHTRSPASYLSLKPPALRFSPDAARDLAAAAPKGMRLHFDSHGTETVDAQNAMLEAMLDCVDAGRLGTTLPGRLSRSLRDADWATDIGLNVRVVKGEWPDPSDAGRDLRAGFLGVIDRLAGRKQTVAVATHDLTLGRAALERLRDAGTPCELEVLLGMPARPLIGWARALGIAVRVYVPYGSGFVMNAVGVLRRNPRLALGIAKAQLGRILAAPFARR